MAPRSSRRSLRYRPGSGSLSVQVLTRASLPSGRGVARSFSGDTLVAGVPGMANPAGQKDATEKDMIEKDTAEKGTTGKDTSRKYNTEKDTTALGTTGSATPTNIPSPPVQPATQLRNAVRRVKTAVHSASTVLGKRKWTRDVPAASRRHSSRLSDAAEKLNHQSAQQSAQQQLPPNKRPKTETASPQTGHGSDETECRKQAPPRRKRWLRSGLYIGQERDFDAKLTESKNRLKRTAIAAGKVRKVKRVLPLPMFTGERLLARGRDFRLPFDVYSPLPSRQPKPEEWRKVSRSESRH